MPEYHYRCDCGNTLVVDKSMSNCHDTEICVECSAEMYRDYHAENTTTNGGDHEARPLHSDALAIHPSQIDEHHRLYPDVPLDNKCRPVLTRYKQREAYLKARGVEKIPHLREW